MNIFDTLILDPFLNALLYIYAYFDTLLASLSAPEWLGAFGLAIIVLTILINLITLPLTIKQQRTTQKTQELQQDKEWIKIQAKYKGNRQKLAEEQQKFYKKKGINPLAGCLPLLLSFPLLIGMYQSIIRALADSPSPLLDFSSHVYSSISAAIIPLNSVFLWMDLGQPERFPIPALEGLPLIGEGIPILAIIVVITSYLQTKLTTPPQPGSSGAGMTQMMGIYMPLFMGYLAYTFAAGLALYFAVGNILRILQAVVIKRFTAEEPVPQKKLAKPKQSSNLKGKQQTAASENGRIQEQFQGLVDRWLRRKPASK